VSLSEQPRVLGSEVLTWVSDTHYHTYWVRAGREASLSGKLLNYFKYVKLYFKNKKRNLLLKSHYGLSSLTQERILVSHKSTKEEEVEEEEEEETLMISE
jgi:hypothetical protein